MTRRLRPVAIFVCKAICLTGCGVASLFILASGYESVYNRSLPYVHTLDSVNLTSVTQSLDLSKHTSTDPKQYGTFGKPVTLKLPGSRTNIRLDIAGPITQGNAWLARASTVHAVIPRPPKSGNIGFLLLYCRAGFRTIPIESLPAKGTNILVDTDQRWRYVYKVTGTRTINQNDAYVPASNRQQPKLMILSNQQSDGLSTLIEADLITVQGADL